MYSMALFAPSFVHVIIQLDSGVKAAAVEVSRSSTILLKHSSTHTNETVLVSRFVCINITVPDWPSFGFTFGRMNEWVNKWVNEWMNECKILQLSMLKLSMHTRCLLERQRLQKNVTTWTPLMQFHSLSLDPIASHQREINTSPLAVPLEEDVDWDGVTPQPSPLQINKLSDLSLSS